MNIDGGDVYGGLRVLEGQGDVERAIAVSGDLEIEEIAVFGISIDVCGRDGNDTLGLATTIGRNSPGILGNGEIRLSNTADVNDVVLASNSFSVGDDAGDVEHGVKVKLSFSDSGGVESRSDSSEKSNQKDSLHDMKWIKCAELSLILYK